MNLHQRILKVQKNVKVVPKSGRNDFHKYDYATERDILDTIKPLLMENGITMTMSTGDLIVNGDLTHIKVIFTLTNPDKPEEQIVCEVWGSGQDKGDKGTYKAYTGAQKYFFAKTFHIATGDDPENDTVDKKPAKTTKKTSDDEAWDKLNDNLDKSSEKPVYEEYRLKISNASDVFELEAVANELKKVVKDGKITKGSQFHDMLTDAYKNKKKGLK